MDIFQIHTWPTIGKVDISNLMMIIISGTKIPFRSLKPERVSLTRTTTFSIYTHKNDIMEYLLLSSEKILTPQRFSWFWLTRVGYSLYTCIYSIWRPNRETRQRDTHVTSDTILCAFHTFQIIFNTFFFKFYYGTPPDWYICNKCHSSAIYVTLVSDICGICRVLLTLNTSPPGQNGRHFADDIFRRIFVNGKFWICIEISLKFVPKGPVDNNQALG